MASALPATVGAPTLPRMKAAHVRLSATAVALLVGAETATAESPLQGFLQLDVQPGRIYELELPRNDGMPWGVTWRGAASTNVPVAGAKPPETCVSPLQPMFRKRLMIKVDDLADWSLKDFQRFARFIEANDAKADLGIVASKSGPEVFAWVKTLDRCRFEICNHTWTHGHGGQPNHYQQPYDVQRRNLELAHEKVRAETGVTMHTFCGGGIKYRGQDVHDQDDATHWVVRNHPDYKVHYHANTKFADRGLGAINSDGVYMPWRYSWFEREVFNDGFIAQLAKRWAAIDWHRPLALGNAAEMIWRFEHPFWNVPESGEIDHMVAQFHPWLWKEPELDALRQLLDHIRRRGDWRFANAYETYKWLRDKDDIVVRKTGPTTYVLDAKSLRFDHRLELRLPKETKVKESIHCQAPES